jgi:hypothetical protein
VKFTPLPSLSFLAKEEGIFLHGRYFIDTHTLSLVGRMFSRMRPDGEGLLVAGTPGLFLHRTLDVLDATNVGVFLSVS